MTIVTVSAKGRVPVDEAWARYADLGRWTEWSPYIRRVDATDDRLVFGTTGRVYGPAGVSVDFVVDSVDDENHRWTWTVRRGPIKLRLEHAVYKRGGGSSTSLRLEGPLAVVVPYAPIARIALQLLVTKNPPKQVTVDRDKDGNIRATADERRQAVNE